MNLRVAIAGAGMIVAHHLPAWRAQAGVSVVGVADPDRACADARADACIGQFVDRMRDGGPFETDPIDNLQTLRLVEDAYAKALTMPLDHAA